MMIITLAILGLFVLAADKEGVLGTDLEEEGAIGKVVAAVEKSTKPQLQKRRCAIALSFFLLARERKEEL